MLQLLISVLMSFGLSFNPDSSSVYIPKDYQQAVIAKVQSTSNYNDLGGDGALDAIVITDQTDPAAAK